MINNGKAKIDNTFGNYSITIPSKKNWFILLFGTAWLGGWYFGFKSAITDLGFSENDGLDGFLTIWLIGWTIGGIVIVSMLLWGYFGIEKIEFNRQYVKLEKTIFGIGLKKRLFINEVRNFRFEKINENMIGGSRWAMWGLGPGKVKFDYGLKTYSFGLGVDDAEANYLIEELNKKIIK